MSSETSAKDFFLQLSSRASAAKGLRRLTTGPRLFGFGGNGSGTGAANSAANVGPSDSGDNPSGRGDGKEGRGGGSTGGGSRTLTNGAKPTMLPNRATAVPSGKGRPASAQALSLMPSGNLTRSLSMPPQLTVENAVERRRQGRADHPAQEAPEPPPPSWRMADSGAVEVQYSQLRCQTGYTHYSGRHQVEQVAGELFTQVRVVAPTRSGSGGEASAAAGGGCGSGSGVVRRALANGAPGTAFASGPVVGGGGASKVPRVHASALVERSRQIRSQPRNTSPINASLHPPFLPRYPSGKPMKKCLILDLDETLVHSSRNPMANVDLFLNIQLDQATYEIYVSYRPYVKEFLEAIAPLFEVVIFTASVPIYCNPVMDAIDPDHLLGSLRLYREHCSMVNGSYVKDLSLLGRPLDSLAIVDNSPVAYLFQQRNAIPITSWFDDKNDEELLRLIPVLEALADAPTVYDVLDNYNALLQLQQEQLQAEQML